MNQHIIIIMDLLMIDCSDSCVVSSLHLLHGSLFLHVHGSQFLPDPVVNLEELCNTPVQADSFSFGQFSLTVLGGNALALAASG